MWTKVSRKTIIIIEYNRRYTYIAEFFQHGKIGKVFEEERKLSIKIVTDSTSYLPGCLRSQYDIRVISLSVNLGSEVHREEEIDTAVFYEKMSRSQELPTSLPLAINDIISVFEELIQEGHSVVGVFLSSEMSETCSRAMIAKKILLEKHPGSAIEVIDSRSNCMQSGFVALTAAKAAAEGLPMSEVVKRAQTVIYKSRFVFCPEVLDYLKKGGRIGKAAALLGSIFQIKPILTVSHGQTDVLDKVRTRERAVKRMLGILLEDVSGRQVEDVVVHHINNEIEGMELAKTIRVISTIII